MSSLKKFKSLHVAQVAFLNFVVLLRGTGLRGRVRGRMRLGWMDGVKVALGNRGMTVEANYRKEWRAL